MKKRFASGLGLVVSLVLATNGAFADSFAYYENVDAGTVAGTLLGDAVIADELGAPPAQGRKDIRLTQNQANEIGTLILDPGQALDAFEMHFRVYIGSSAPQQGAGFSVSYSDLDGSPLGLEGDNDPGLSFSLEFGLLKELRVEYNGQSILQRDMSDPADFTPDAYNDFGFWISSDEVLHVYSNGISMGQVELSSFGGWNPQANWRFGFGANAHASTPAIHRIDDILIRSAAPSVISMNRLDPEFINASYTNIGYQLDFDSVVQSVDGLVVNGAGSTANISAINGPAFSILEDFSGGVANEGTLMGTAGISSDRASLGSSGAWHLQPAEVQPVFRAAFDLEITAPISVGRAYFRYGQNANDLSNGAPGPSGNGLQVNVSKLPSAEGSIVLHYNGAELNTVPLRGLNSLNEQIAIDVREDGLCSIFFGSDVVTVAHLPAWDPQPDWGMALAGFAASFGGVVHTDNITIENGRYDVLLENLAGVGELSVEVSETNTIMDYSNFGLSPKTYDSGESYMLMMTPPVPVLSSGAGSLINGPVTVDVDTGAVTSDFDAGDLDPVNATIDDFSGSDGNYSFTLTPIALGSVSVSVPAGGYQDAAGNLNAASNVLNYQNDPDPPVVVAQIPGPSSVVASVGSIEVTFSEPVYGVIAMALTVSSSHATSVSGSGAGPYTFSGFTEPPNGNVFVSISPGTFSDAAGNVFGGTFWSFTRNDAVPTASLSIPNVALSSSVNSPSVFEVDVLWSEDVTGFSLDDLQLVNAEASNLNGSGAIYSFDLEPLADGLVSVAIGDNAVTAVAPPGASNPGSASFHFTYDTTAPLIVLNGDSAIGVACGSGYVDPGVASAVDAIDGDVSGLIVLGGDTFSTLTPPGDYVVSYAVTDAAGNTAYLERDVTVLADCPLAVSVGGDGQSTFSIEAGDDVVLIVEVTGALGPINYDWQYESANKSFASLGAPNSPSLVLANLDITDEGNYQCVVSDAVTTVVSPSFNVTVQSTALPLANVIGLVMLVAAVAGLGIRRREGAR